MRPLTLGRGPFCVSCVPAASYGSLRAMFTKVNAKQEQFLWLVVEGMPQERAYASIYGEAKSREVCATNASRLLTKANVIARRQELIEQRRAEQPITVKFLTTELLGVATQAKALGQAAAASGALMGIAKLHGLLVDKMQVDALVRKPTESPEAPAEMSEEDWLTKYGVVNLQPVDTQPMISMAEPLVVEAEPSVEE